VLFINEIFKELIIFDNQVICVSHLESVYGINKVIISNQYLIGSCTIVLSTHEYDVFLRVKYNLVLRVEFFSFTILLYYKIIVSIFCVFYILFMTIYLDDDHTKSYNLNMKIIMSIFDVFFILFVAIRMITKTLTILTWLRNL
jgi:hypothetical protein